MKQATVEDASDSEDDNANTQLAQSHSEPSGSPEKEKEKEKVSVNTDWQAVWSAPQNAYYFYNTKTLETTWINPLVPPPNSTSTPTDRASSPVWDPSVETLPTSSAPTDRTQFTYGSQTQTASSSSIDPSLAHLLPGGFDAQDPSTYTAQARFNTRNGRYEADPRRAPDHLSDFNRMKRQNDVFFDTDAWEKDREAAFEREQMGGGKKKKITKSDVERFKEKKEAKKKMKNAWLRS